MSVASGEGRPIIAFPFHDWYKGIAEGFRTRDGHLLQELSRSPDVGPIVVVDRPVSRIEHWVKGRDYHVGGTVIWEASKGAYRCWITRTEEGVLVVDTGTPDVVAPAVSARGWWFDVFRRARVVDLIQDAVRAAGAVGAPAIAWVPTVAPVVQALNPTRFVFDSLDNWLIHPTLKRFQRQASAGYAALLPMADAVFVAAPRSARALATWRPDARVLPNGVDVGHFRGRHPRPADLPDGLIVGYAGKLAERIDTELVASVAAAMPQVTFAFVGQVLHEPAVQRLRSIRNVQFLGDRHYDILPAYVQHFDVAWIPHRVGEGESGGDPIKLYEYWAAGRPVVSTPIDGLGRFSDTLPLVSTPEAAIEAIEAALSNPSVPAVPGDRSWAAIAAQLLAELLPNEPEPGR